MTDQTTEDAMSDVDVAALKEAAEKATPGPWCVADGLITHVNGHSERMYVIECYSDEPGERDAAFIAAANPAAVLALIERVEAAEAAVARVRATVDTVVALRNSGRYDDPSVVGWLDAVIGDVTAALDGVR